jgi:uncharacterized Tic20 family protein
MNVPPNVPPSGDPGLNGVSQDERSQAMLCWLLTIVAGFIPPIIFFSISNEKPYVKRQAALALTLAIAVFAGMFISGILMIVLIGFLLLPAVAIWSLVVCIQGAIAANKGEDFNPALIDKLCMSIFKL